MAATPPDANHNFVGPNITLPNGELLDRTFFIAPQGEVMAHAFALAGVILKKHTLQALEDFVASIAAAGRSNHTHSRTAALLATQVGSLLCIKNGDFGNRFHDILGPIAKRTFFTAWLMHATVDDVAEGEDGPWREEDDSLFDAAVFVADLYAFSLISADLFKDCLNVLAQGFRSAGHLQFLAVMLSRGSSHHATRIESEWYEDMMDDIRDRFATEFSVKNKTEEEEVLFTVISLLEEDAELDDNDFGNNYCNLDYEHVADSSISVREIFKI